MLKKLWEGEFSLLITFLIFFLVGCGFPYILDVLGNTITNLELTYKKIIFFTIFLCLFPYTLFMLVSLLRSARNHVQKYKGRLLVLYGYLAYVICAVIAYSFIFDSVPMIPIKFKEYFLL